MLQQRKENLQRPAAAISDQSDASCMASDEYLRVRPGCPVNTTELPQSL